MDEDGFIVAGGQWQKIKYKDIVSVEIKRLIDGEIVSFVIKSNSGPKISLAGFEKTLEILKSFQNKNLSAEFKESVLSRRPNPTLRLIFVLAIVFGVLGIGFFENKWGWFMLIMFFGPIFQTGYVISQPGFSQLKKILSSIILSLYVFLVVYVVVILFSHNEIKALYELF